MSTVITGPGGYGPVGTDQRIMLLVHDLDPDDPRRSGSRAPAPTASGSPTACARTADSASPSTAPSPDPADGSAGGMGGSGIGLVSEPVVLYRPRLPDR